MDSITKPAYAKINLTLDVLEKLPNGYHNLKMIMQQISMHDIVTVSKIEQNCILLDCNKEFSKMEDNIIYKALVLMKERYNIKEGIKVNLEKNIYLSAGLAGGSTDCATAMMCVNELFNLNLELEELMILGNELGSDVPYCMFGGIALAEGTGNKLARLNDIKKTYVVIANPLIEVSTKEVFENFKFENQKQSDYNKMFDAIDKGNVKEIANNLNNMLESVTIEKYPVIGLIKESMIQNGALGALMSGSGATVYGYFENESTANKSLNALLDTFSTIKAEVCFTI